MEQEFIPYHAETSLGPGRVLILAPHPDDEVFGCGGSIMRHREAGDPVQVVVVTDGAFGKSAHDGDYAQARQTESRDAAAVLAYGEPLFWGLPDRGLDYDEPLIERILAAIEAWEADLVYAPSWWEIHPDHLVLAFATAEAVRRSPRPIQFVMYEVAVPLHPNRLLDITSVRERKHKAMACFASQLRQQDYDRQVAALDRFRSYTLPRHVRAAEAYRLVTGDELRAPALLALRPSPLRPLRTLAWSLRIPPSQDEEESQRLMARLQAAREEIEAIRRSTSWRLTAPLRWLVQRLKGIEP